MKLSLRQLRCLWIGMFLLQEMWLAAAWLTGALADPRKLMVVGVYSLVCLFIVLLLSDKTVARLRSLYGWLDEHHIDFLALLGLVLFVTGIIYIQGQRIWTDEAENFRFSSHFVKEGLSMLVFGVDLGVIRWATAFFSLGALAAAYLLGRTLYNRSVGLLAAVYLATFPLFVRVGTAGMLDTQTLFFFTVAVLLTVMILRKPSGWLGAALGLTLGLGMLTKYSIMLALPLIVALVIAALARLDKSAPDRWKKAAVLLRPFMIAALISGALFLSWAGYADQIGVNTPLAGTFQLFRPAPEQALPRDDADDQNDTMSFSLG